MSIEKWMSKNIIALDIDDDLAKAKLAFDEHKIHHLLILNGKELAGVITDRDLYKQLSPHINTRNETPRDTSLLRKKVNLFMSRELVTAYKDTTLNEAVLLFYDNRISCLPIVNDDFIPIGIITWRDIIKIVAVQYRHKQLGQHTKA
ncbi:CBS domain-containing protein [Thalassotalea marina]|uniref:CBS domain-containing protein n=1 Tax=Thalassotalea marina TaxID=1673741 RepID=A0A919BCV0_9GAMM|nr:CBS domain-containing protein [Thalassotalea marina]GHF83917.1 CBS domain-containing protein [Thalassotalea marina]